MCTPKLHATHCKLMNFCWWLQMLKQMRSAAQEGFWAFCQVATIG